MGVGFKSLPNNLQILKLSLSDNELGENEENLKFLSDGFKMLPKSLKDLKLDLSGNKLGEYGDDLRYLDDALKNLPDNLLKLKLELSELGNNEDNFKYLADGLK